MKIYQVVAHGGEYIITHWTFLKEENAKRKKLELENEKSQLKEYLVTSATKCENYQSLSCDLYNSKVNEINNMGYDYYVIREFEVLDA